MNRMKKEPLAIIGIGCRFPGGASDSEKFWDLLKNKRDAMVDIPEKRWDWRQFCDSNKNKKGKAYNFQGGFLQEDIELFDPLFFGISPREARIMDPQQRLLLEVAWEAFENAGITNEQLSGSNTGVFIGGFWLDHQINQFCSLNITVASSHSPMSATLTLLSNRLSYVFNLKGPSLTIDTACSSSLVATHYACQSIWSGESDMVLVGGANVMTSSSNSIGLSKGQFLSDHSRCMTFDERASGYARGEGAAVILIKPLKKAQEEGLPVYALIRGTGVNQDGQTPGLTLPNPEAQKTLIRNVYQQAKVKPSDVHYIEAHGTGTKAGDRAEAEALHAVLNDQGKRRQKAWVGSVKTNMGHLEAAAGMAGIIKAALCLKHKKIPGNLHFKTPNPEIPFDQYCFNVPTELMDWPDQEERFAGVNAFGYGGTNAHILLQAAQDNEVPVSNYAFGRETDVLLPISAQSLPALKSMAGKWQDYLCNQPGEGILETIVKTTCRHRSHQNVRSFIQARDKSTLIKQLQAISKGLGPDPKNIDQDKKLVMVFTGMGPQWPGMGCKLYESMPTFRHKVDECDELFTAISGWSIKNAMLENVAASRMHETQVAQPANFVLQVALTACLEEWGIRADAIIGHSVGEVAAVHVAGVLSLEESLLVCYHRSRLQQTKASPDSGMLAVNMPEKDVLELFKKLNLDLDLAAVNSAGSVTISGNKADLDKLSAYLTENQQFNRLLNVEVAFHSRQMEPIKEELQAVLAGLHPQQEAIPLYSTVTGGRIGGQRIDASYWWENVRKPVHFQRGIRALMGAGYFHFLEVGPHPVLAQSIQAELTSENKEGQLITTLNRKKPELESFFQSVGTLYQLGYSLNWEHQINPDAPMLALPTYPWQREHYWFESEALSNYRFGQKGHRFLNRKVFGPQPAWEIDLNEHQIPYLNDHCIGSHVVVPGAMYVEAGLAVAEQINRQWPMALENIHFHQVLSLNEESVQRLHISYSRLTRRVELYSTTLEEQAPWLHHATLDLNTEMIQVPESKGLLDNIIGRCREQLNVENFYEKLSTRQLNYGPFFKPIKAINRGDREVLIRLEPSVLPDEKDGYLFGPTLLDALFQSLIVVEKEQGRDSENKTFIPVAIDRLILYRRPSLPAYGWTSLLWKNDKALKGNAVLYDSQGRVTAEVLGITCQHLKQEHQEEKALSQEWFYEWTWQEKKRPQQEVKADNQAWLLIHSDTALGHGLIRKGNAENVMIKALIQSDLTRASWDTLRESNPPQATDHTILLIGQATRELQPGSLYDRMVSGCQQVIDWLHNYIQANNDMPAKLSVVTIGLHSSKEASVTALAGSPLWGLIRVMRSEFEKLSCQLIDLDSDMDEKEQLEQLWDELRQPVLNEEVILRKNMRLVHRLKPLQQSVERDEEIKMISRDQQLILVDQPESKQLYFKSAERILPSDDEVEVKLASFTLDKQSGDEKSYRFGSEFTGTITAVGSKVTGLTIGDEVCVFYPCSPATFINVPCCYVCKVVNKIENRQPFSMSMMMAAYGLLECARLKAGDKLFITGAATDTGVAAAYIGQLSGAEITAFISHDDEKRYFSGIDGITFAERHRPHVWGHADVIIHCHPDQLDDKLIAALRPFGKVVHVIHEKQLIGMTAPLNLARKNGSLHLLNLKWLLEEHPEDGRKIIENMAAVIEQKNLILPMQVFPFSKLNEAIAQMNDSDNIHKILITMDNMLPVIAKKQMSIVNSQGSYIVTGGTSGFGLEVARWLAEKGAGHVLLASRSGDKRLEIKQAVECMLSQGLSVSVMAVDVSDEKAVEHMIQTCNNTGKPLKGIIHSAMILEDSYLKNITNEQLQHVMDPKIKGALNLDAATTQFNLDFFVMFSSITSLIGNPGQAAYAAANAFLDDLARIRRQQGKTATTINWGVLAQTGVLTRNREVAMVLKHTGLKGFSNQQALRALDCALALDLTQAGVFDVDWGTWFEQNSKQAVLPLFAHFSRTVNRFNEKVSAYLEELAPMDKALRLKSIEGKITGVIGQVANMPETSIQRNENIMNYGVDSLMALDLSRRLKSELSLELSMMELMNGPSVSKLSSKLMDQLSPYFDQIVMEQIDEMDEAALDALLAEELSK
ncbi:MAG: SDR family NAD(P)-dependent oxidoreductase [Chitinispirillaceae bacterium]|nr:SDR family NAD(P)-dependent oxidoreductase [Chitinispirillaceae bacterium]